MLSLTAPSSRLRVCVVHRGGVRIGIGNALSACDVRCMLTESSRACVYFHSAGSTKEKSNEIAANPGSKHLPEVTCQMRGVVVWNSIVTGFRLTLAEELCNHVSIHTHKEA